MSQLVKVATLTKPKQLLSAARHNLREIQAELGADSHIDALRIGLNLRLAGPETAKEVAGLADQIRTDACIPPTTRKNGVRAGEVMVSLPVGTTVDVAAFFADALEWVRDFFPVPILSAIVHMDEAAPHMHVLLLPLSREGAWLGHKVFGAPAWVKGMHVSFHDAVACRYGLTNPGRMKKDERLALVGKLLEGASASVADGNLATVHALIQAMAARLRDSVLLSVVESIALPEKPYREFAGGKKLYRESPELLAESMPILAEPAESLNSLSCVEFSLKPVPERAANDRTPAPAGDIAHELDAEQSGIWDEVTGEFVPAPTKPTGSARAWARAELVRLTGRAAP